MKRVQVRRLLDFDPLDFINKLKSPLLIEYEDGVVVEHTAHEIAINRMVFELPAMYHNMSIVSAYSIHNYYVAGIYVADTLNKTFEAVVMDIIVKYSEPEFNRVYLDNAYRKMFQIMESVYNDIVCNNLHYVSGLNIMDFLEIQLKPKLMEAIEDVRNKRSLETVDRTYAILEDIIYNDPDVRDNIIAKGYRAGTIKDSQVKQLLASRGFVTEIDGSIFKYPIASSFVLGMDNIYDMAVESRSGAKSLYLSNKAVSTAEYFSREMQLVTMNVEKLVDKDCGNKEYLEWLVTDKDLPSLLGKHYFVDDGEFVIDKDCTGLIGTVVRIRNGLRCKAKNKRDICTSCFGRMAASIPRHANLGHICVTNPTSMISQRTLSTKHITTSASSDGVVLDDVSSNYLLIKNKDRLAFRASVFKKKSKYELLIPQKSAGGLTNIRKASNIRMLNLGRVSKLDYLGLLVVNNNSSVEDTLTVKQSGRYGNFTYEFLEYVAEHGYTLDDNDRFVIDLTYWKPGVPFVVMPQVEFNYIDLAKIIKEEFKGMKDTGEEPEAFLHRMFVLFNSKLSVNLALLEVIVYAFVVSDPKLNKFDFGRNSENSKQTRIQNIMTNRSLGGGLGWERVMNTLLSPKSTYGINNVDHPLDVMLMPNEVLMDKYNKL